MRIVTFHGIGTPDRPVDGAEGRYWISRDFFCEILDRIRLSARERPVAITFDDGNRSDLDIAVPELRRRGLAATFFVLTGRFAEPGFLDRGDVRALLREGMEVGSHGIDHLDWTSLSRASLGRELGQSKRELDGLSGASIPASIPFGRYDRAVLRALASVGYACAYSSDGGNAKPDAFLRPRTSIRDAMTGSDVDALLNGAVPCRDRLRRSLAMARKRLI